MVPPKKTSTPNQESCGSDPQADGSVFFQEWLAAGQPPEQLSISSVCNARCIFCSNRMNPFSVIKNVFRDIEDIKLQLSLCSANYEGAIYMSDSLPGRISEGEAFLHPVFFEILTLVREKFLTNRLHFTSNASLLDEPFVRKLSAFRPIEINISLHSAQPKLWARIFRSTEKRARTALSAPALLKAHGIDFTGTIVPLPRICGWDDLEYTFDFLVKEGARSVILWWPGFSEKTPAELRKQIECPWKEFDDFVKRMRGKYPRFQIVPQPDLLQPRQLPVRRIMNFTLQGNLKTSGGAFRDVLWLVSEAACPEISRAVAELAADFPNKHRVFPVPNRSYGGNIRVSGLLMVSDFLAAGREALERWPFIDLVLIPKTAFDVFFRDLGKTPAYRIPEVLERTTWMVSEQGSYLSLRGRSFVAPQRDLKKILEKILARMDGSMRAERFDEVSALVASFPIPTSEGILKRREFREFLRRTKNLLPEGAAAGKRLFEKLDDRRVVCKEDWPTDDPSASLSRWSFFKKKEREWKLEMLFLGPESGSHNSVDTGSE